ncbi:hypothetical protein TWF696_008595 [Orbilia brochopaga]|uniref:Uncharacterized protein n=1 Tax=Orbilia brochopaga TaxID=3140254 RepID=A0AAV9ULY1_9PEZI
MRWLTSLAVWAVAAGLARAAVPEALSEAFVDGETLTAKFGGTTVRDGSTISAESVSSSPLLALNSPKSRIPANTLYTVILVDITNSRDPSTESTLHYAASNLRVTSSSGSDLVSGTVDFPYAPPASSFNNANYVFLVYSQSNKIEGLQGLPNGSTTFSINTFRQSNQLQLADTGLGYTVSERASYKIITQRFTFPNTTTTSASSVPPTTSNSPSPTQPPPEPITSYFTLPNGGMTRTVIYTQPNEPGSTVAAPPPSSSTPANPSVITGNGNAAPQNAPSRSVAALVGLGIVFFAFV